MSISITPDVFGAAGRKDGTGLYITRYFRALVSAPGGPEIPPDILEHPQIPQPGTQHPRRPQIVVTQLSLDSIKDRHDVIVRVDYGPPSTTGADAEIGDVSFDVLSDLIQETTITDRDGEVMRSQYLRRVKTGSAGSSVTLETVTHEVEVQRPTYSLVWQRLEQRPAYPLARTTSGYVNSTPYLGERAFQWLLNVNSSQQSPRRHLVTYRMTFNALETGWLTVLTHSQNGIIPSDISANNGIKTYKNYPEFDFRKLALPSPDAL